MFIFKVVMGLIDAPFLKNKLRINDLSVDRNEFFETGRNMDNVNQSIIMCKVFGLYENIDINLSVAVQRQRLCDIQLANCL